MDANVAREEIRRLAAVVIARSDRGEDPDVDGAAVQLARAARDLDGWLGGAGFSVRIETSNAAFEQDPGEEVAHILERVAGMLREEYTSGPLYDVNGNVVAFWDLSGDEYRESGPRRRA